ncbi:uncharacterized [Tachysurus ichikawai]
MLKIMSSQHFPHPNSQPVTAPCCCTRSRAQIISTLTPHLRGSAAERASALSSRSAARGRLACEGLSWEVLAWGILYGDVSGSESASGHRATDPQG